MTPFRHRKPLPCRTYHKLVPPASSGPTGARAGLILPPGPTLQPEAARPRFPAHRCIVDIRADVRIRDRSGGIEFAPKVLPHRLRVDAPFSQTKSDCLVRDPL